VPSGGQRDDDVDGGQTAADHRHVLVRADGLQLVGDRVRVGDEALGPGQTVHVLGAVPADAQDGVVERPDPAGPGAEHGPARRVAGGRDGLAHQVHPPAAQPQLGQAGVGGLLQVLAVLGARGEAGADLRVEAGRAVGQFVDPVPGPQPAFEVPLVPGAHRHVVRCRVDPDGRGVRLVRPAAPQVRRGFEDREAARGGVPLGQCVDQADGGGAAADDRDRDRR
jgi:hypothetical protein